MADTSAIATAIGDWFLVEARDLPWRRPGTTAWAVLVSEVMLQQTPVPRVVPVYEEWLARWPSARDFAAAGRDDVLRAWGRLGYPRRAIRLHEAAKAIVERHDGEVPRDIEDLLALPGVGDYTARAVAAFAFGDRHEVVDTNIRRVLARVLDGRGEALAPSRRRDLDTMARLLPEEPEAARIVNAGTMELGALVCTARAPRCTDCPVREHCAWRDAGSPAAARAVRAQPRYEGSDRQVRGIVLAAASDRRAPLRAADLLALWPDPVQLDRAVAGLGADGLLVVGADGSARLPR